MLPCLTRVPWVVLQVSVLGQTSALSSQTISYSPPSLVSVSPTVLPTDGGDVVLSGWNLGSDTSKTIVYVNGVPRPIGFNVGGSRH